jgi:hypothetical protein
MKIFKLLFIPALAFSALVINNSCDADKLELINPNELLPDTYFTSDKQVESAVNAIYGSLQTTSLYNRHIWFGYDNMSHENSGNNQLEPDKKQYLHFSFDAGHGAIEGFWESCYRGINKANFLINNKEKIDAIPESEMSTARKTKFMGEAKFMRALYYFMLVDRFGDVPIYLSVPADNQGLPRSPKADVWALIEADLLDATTMCLDKADIPAGEKGRASKGAAWALLGKARLFQEKYAEALAAFEEIEGYDLEPNYFDNFREETENGIESLFEVQFSLSAGNAARWNSDRSDVGLNETTFRAQEYGCFNWFNVYPSVNLLNEYETAADNGVKDDPRLGFNILQNGDTYNNGVSIVAIPNDTVRENNAILEVIVRRGWNKYQNYYKQPSVLGEASGINMKVIRYADVLLMMAECEALRPGGVLADAVDLMNLVRQRADVDMPLYGSTEMDAIYPVGTIPQFMVALEHERKVELAGEQVRFPDLVRWGRLGAFMAEVEDDLPILEQRALVFDVEKHMLWPIPQAEIDRNINIGQEDQNPGY